MKLLCVYKPFNFFFLMLHIPSFIHVYNYKNDFMEINEYKDLKILKIIETI